jgi:hypothetical protein
VISHDGEEVQLPEFTVTYPPAHCVACGHLIGRGREGFEGRFPVYALQRVVHVHALVCIECLNSPDGTSADDVHQLAVAVFRHVGEWLRECPSFCAPVRNSCMERDSVG